MEERFKLADQPWRVLEFYSGIGGMRYSIIRAGLNAEIVQAFDINDTANDVYEFNFHHRPYQGNIQSLSTDDLDRYRAHVWLLSPPCQPYTRQGLQKHSGDARASSFLKILELLSNTSRPPAMLFVENVVGFEASDTHSQMIEILAKADFVTQEFILSPLQFGVPYSRPRYFCLAKKKPLFFRYQQFNSQLIWTPSMLFGHEDNVVMNEVDPSKESCEELVQYCEPIERFLELKSCNQLEMENEIPFSTSVSNSDSKALGRCDEENGSSGNSLEHYFVPLNLIERWGSVMDIVYSNSKRCCCFTKSYYRYIKGTGSLLATIHPKKNCKETPLKEQCLRYFTPREVANLHSFPEDFNFPHNISLRQCYALLGNSLSVAVVAPLLQYLFSEPP